MLYIELLDFVLLLSVKIEDRISKFTSNWFDAQPTYDLYWHQLWTSNINMSFIRLIEVNIATNKLVYDRISSNHFVCVQFTCDMTTETQAVAYNRWRTGHSYRCRLDRNSINCKFHLESIPISETASRVFWNHVQNLTWDVPTLLAAWLNL